ALISRTSIAESAVTFQTEIEDISMHSSLLFPLGIIINEIVVNALKYAFIGKKDGKIALTVLRKDSQTMVVVKDDGMGIPDEVMIDKATGFGMQMVRLLVKQIHSSIDIVKDRGTKYVIKMEA
ncbi:MAG: sensor histidine kinase, partial [Bacillota bacterium]|nr:sensor histidine kinase [Bacillota bacterium]